MAETSSPPGALADQSERVLVAEAEAQPLDAFRPLRVDSRAHMRDSLVELTNVQLGALGFIDRWITSYSSDLKLRIPAEGDDDDMKRLLDSPEYIRLDRDLPQLIAIRDSINSLSMLEEIAALGVQPGTEARTAKGVTVIMNKIFGQENYWQAQAKGGIITVKKTGDDAESDTRQLSLDQVYRSCLRKFKSNLQTASKITDIPLPTEKGAAGMHIRTPDDVNMMMIKKPIVIHDIVSPLSIASSAVPMVPYAADVIPLINSSIGKAYGAAEASKEVWLKPLRNEDIPVSTLMNMTKESFAGSGETFDVQIIGNIPKGTVLFSTEIYASLLANAKQNIEKAYMRRDELLHTQLIRIGEMATGIDQILHESGTGSIVLSGSELLDEYQAHQRDMLDSVRRVFAETHDAQEERSLDELLLTVNGNDADIQDMAQSILLEIYGEEGKELTTVKTFLDACAKREAELTEAVDTVRSTAAKRENTLDTEEDIRAAIFDRQQEIADILSASKQVMVTHVLVPGIDPRIEVYFDDDGPGFPKDLVESNKFTRGDTRGYGSRRIATSGYAMGSLTEFFKVYGAALTPQNRTDSETGRVSGARLHLSLRFAPAPPAVSQ
jgi:hypothetical protein